jgi:hypothetical protein
VSLTITRAPGRTFPATDSGSIRRRTGGPAVTVAIDMPGATGAPAGISARKTRPLAGAITAPCPATLALAPCCARAAATCASAARAAATA